MPRKVTDEDRLFLIIRGSSDERLEMIAAQVRAEVNFRRQLNGKPKASGRKLREPKRESEAEVVMLPTYSLKPFSESEKEPA